MKRILYAGGSFMTGDEIAAQIMRLAANLANANRAADLDVPAIGPDGRLTSVRLVIGPASQLLTEDVLTHQPDPEPAEFVSQIEEVSRHLTGLTGIDPSPLADDSRDNHRKST